MNQINIMTMFKKYTIAGTPFEIPVYDKEIVDYINTTYTKEEKLKLFNGMSEKRVKEVFKMINGLKTNGEFISAAINSLKKVSGDLTLTERTALKKVLNSINDECKIKDYEKN